MAKVDDDIVIPPESQLLQRAYSKAGLSAQQLADATGKSKATIHIALNGYRYRQGYEGKQPAKPSADVLALLASALRVSPEELREVGREDAAMQLAEAQGETSKYFEERSKILTETGRSLLARQVLSAFTDDDLVEELKRRGHPLTEAVSD